MIQFTHSRDIIKLLLLLEGRLDAPQGYKNKSKYFFCTSFFCFIGNFTISNKQKREEIKKRSNFHWKWFFFHYDEIFRHSINYTTHHVVQTSSLMQTKETNWKETKKKEIFFTIENWQKWTTKGKHFLLFYNFIFIFCFWTESTSIVCSFIFFLRNIG